MDGSIPNSFLDFSNYIGSKYCIDDLPDIIAVHGKIILFKTYRSIDEKGETIVKFTFKQTEMNSVSSKESGRLTSGYFYVMLLSMLQNTFLCAVDYTNTLYGVIKDFGLIATTQGKSNN